MGGKSSQSSQQITIPPEVLARYNAVNARAERVANTPFQQYSTDPSAFVAPLTPTQQAGVANTNAYAGAAQPYYQGAAGMTLAGAQGVNPSDLNSESVNKYLSPYLSTVLGSTAAMQNQLNQQQMAGQTGNAIRAGAFGGDRAGIAAANLAQQQQMANAKIFSDIANQGYNQALTTAQGQQALGLSAAQANRQALQAMGAQFGNIGAGAQAAGLQGAQAQLAAGQTEQQTEQAGKTALYNQFLQQQSYPFQVAQFLANIAEGTGALSGSTTTTNQAMGGFSDKRLKENIRQIGKTFDGQNIYSYNFKGEPNTEIGLMAQEVEKRHPEAVGLAGGYKTVRYDKATDDAADRGHFAYGGSAMGGGVMPSHAGEGFYDGGYVGFDPGLMQQILQSYQQMYAPLEGQKGGLGAASYVPESNLSVGQLMAPGDLPATPNAFENMQGMVNLGTGLGSLGGNLNLWDYTDEQRAQSARKKKSTPPEEHAYGGLAGGRHGYATDGSVSDKDFNEIVVVGDKTPSDTDKSARDKPAPQVPVPIQSSNQAPAPAPLVIKGVARAPVTQAAKNSLDIPQIGNTVGLPVAPGLSSLTDSTGSILSGIGSIGSAAAAFSDKRLKENIKAVGKTFDGQTVYSYNFKGDPQTRMGLIAQEVEKHHPEAVGQVHGLKTVDYRKATGLAAHRGHFADGGEADESGPMGMNIPQQGNTIGLAGAPGLSSLQDSTGSVLQGLGSIGQAFGQGSDKSGDSGDSDNQPKNPNEPKERGVPIPKADGGGVDDYDPLHDYLHNMQQPSHGLYDGGETLALKENPIFKRLTRQLDPFLTEEEERGVGANKPHEAMGLVPREQFLNESRKPLTGLMPAPASYSQERSMSGASGKIDPEVVSFFMNKGLTEGQALGIAAGIHAESGNDPLAINKQSGAMGIGQWLGPRKKSILRQYGDTPSKRDQLEFLWQELSGGDRGGPAVLAEKDPKSVLSAYITKFMRPAAGRETEGDLSRGHSALGYAYGGLAGARRGYATDGSVDKDPENLLPDLYRDVTPDEAAKISAEATATGNITPANAARFVRTLGTPEKVGEFYSLMGQKGFGVAGQAPSATQPQQTAERPVSPNGRSDRGFFGNIAHGDFFGGLGKGKAESWIPLLTGLGTWATTPTRSALSGILAGTAAGAQAAQAQREYGLKGRQVAAVETEAVSDRIRANSDLLRAELTNAEQIGGAIQNTMAMIAMARQSGMDTRELNAQLVALNNRRISLLQNGGEREGATGTITGITKSPIEGLKPYDPTNPASVLAEADIQHLGGIELPSTQTRAQLAGQGITLTPSGEYGNIPSYGPAKGGVQAAAEAPQQQQADNREFVTGIRNDYSQYGDSAPIVQSIPPAISTQPTPDFVKDLQTKVAGILKMTPDQASQAFGTSYDAAALARMGNYLGIPIDTSQPVVATNALLKGLHARFDNLHQKYQAIKQIESFASKRGTTVYDPRFDVRGRVTDYVYGGGKQ